MIGQTRTRPVLGRPRIQAGRLRSGREAVDFSAACGALVLWSPNLPDFIRLVKPGSPLVLYVNAMPFEAEDYPRTLREFEIAGLWRVEKIEHSNYMDALERPGRLIVGVRFS